MIRRTVYFIGRVQGVGFRVTVAELVGDGPVVGSVRNLPDGRVEAIFEGDEAQLDAAVRAIRDRMFANLTDVRSQDSPATGEFKRFEIRR